MDRFKVGILGATGMVGQRFVHMLMDHPYFETVLLLASERSEGKSLRDFTRFHEFPDSVGNMKIQNISSALIKKSGVRILFSALPSEVAGDIEAKLAKDGFYVFSNAASHRMDSDVPVMVPEVNHEHMGIVEFQRKRRRYDGFMVTNPNCSAAGLVVPLRPIIDNFRVEEVVVSTYQALSGAGYPGVASMDSAANVIPFIRDEEPKLEEETKKMLGNCSGESFEPHRIGVYANCVRVPVRDGHLETAVIRFSEEVEEEEVKKVLKDFSSYPQQRRLPTAPERPIIVRDEQNRPQPTLDVNAGEPERARGMAVTVGRLRKAGDRMKLVLLSHNLVRGAAGGSILNAETAYAKGYLR